MNNLKNKIKFKKMILIFSKVKLINKLIKRNKILLIRNKETMILNLLIIQLKIQTIKHNLNLKNYLMREKKNRKIQMIIYLLINLKI